jgi:hypothetical protein
MAMPPNLHSLYMNGMYQLGVEYRGCGRKALVPAEAVRRVQRRHDRAS